MTSPLERLREAVWAYDRLIVAYSGGVDSALLAAVAHSVLGERSLAVTAVSPSLPERERRAARELARTVGMPHLEVCTDEADREEYVVNDKNRCFHCKSALFDALDPLATLLDATVALGTNADDLGDYRPGQQAARERGVVAPMLDAGLTKADVREASAAMGLPTSEKPAAACLASRVAYGDPVTPELLARIERAEDALHDLGFAVCRVRSHANGQVARVEVPGDELARVVGSADVINQVVCDAGFAFCSVDLAGFRSGSMNTLLPLPTVRAGV
jgi:pyridinium-3,5-biscarboxylic acid mononucleotide sulfurtransferase